MAKKFTMIQEGYIWTYIIDPRAEKKFAGMWKYEGDASEFKAQVPKLNELAEQGLIAMAKFANKDPKFDPCPYLKHSVLCVYTTKERDESIRNLIYKHLGLWTDVYKTEEESRRDWQPGGKLYEEYISYWRKKRGFL